MSRRRRERKTGIQRKILTYFLSLTWGSICLLLLVSTVILTFSSYNASRNSIRNNVNMATRQINLLLSQIRDSARAFSTSAALQGAMCNAYSEDMNPQRSFLTDMRTAIYSSINIESFAKEMTLVSLNGMTCRYPSGRVTDNRADLQADWYRETVARDGRICLYTPMEEGGASAPGEEPVNLVLEKAVIQIETGQLLGAMRILVRESIFSDTFPDIQRRVGGEYYIVNGQGIIVAAQQKDQLFTQLCDAALLQDPGALQDAKPYAIRGGYMLACVGKADLLDWYVVGMVPVLTTFTRNTPLFIAMLAVGLAFTGVVLAVSKFLARQLVSPILALVSATQDVSKGNLSQEIPVVSEDEIGELARSFNGMLGDIRDLTYQIWLEQHQKKEYALQFMQTQINPHLLYNSIMSINHLIASGSSQEASSALVHLGRYYQKVLHKNSMSVTVEDDIELCVDYMILQQQIHSGMFRYQVCLDPQAARCDFLKLTLQPLVENSILHGFKGYLRQGGLIRIRAQADGAAVTICVEDNGRGISPDSLGALRSALLQRRGLEQHLGLRSISERLRLRFGEACSMTLDSQQGKGTRVTIRIPAQG